MTKVRNRTEASFVFGLQSNLQRAQRLGQFELFWDDARKLNTEPAKYFAVTKDDIKRTVARYLSPARRSLVEVSPTENAAAESAKTGAGDHAANPPPPRPHGDVPANGTHLPITPHQAPGPARRPTGTSMGRTRTATPIARCQAGAGVEGRPGEISHLKGDRT